jgi:hypothetical protein
MRVGCGFGVADAIGDEVILRYKMRRGWTGETRAQAKPSRERRKIHVHWPLSGKEATGDLHTYSMQEARRLLLKAA